MANLIFGLAGNLYANLEQIIGVPIKTNRNARISVRELSYIALAVSGSGLSLYGFVNNKAGYTATGLVMGAIGAMYLLARISKHVTNK